MKRYVWLLIFFFTFAQCTVTHSEEINLAGIPPEVYKTIKNKAIREWPNDWNMQKFVIKQQIEGYNYVKSYRNSQVPSDILSIIKQKAASEWANDWNMQKFVIRQQVGAYLELSNSPCKRVKQHR